MLYHSIHHILLGEFSLAEIICFKFPFFRKYNFAFFLFVSRLECMFVLVLSYSMWFLLWMMVCGRHVLFLSFLQDPNCTSYFHLSHMATFLRNTTPHAWFLIRNNASLRLSLPVLLIFRSLPFSLYWELTKSQPFISGGDFVSVCVILQPALHFFP